MRARTLTSRALGDQASPAPRRAGTQDRRLLGFTAYVVEVATTATGPAIDLGFDIAVYAALVVHIARRRLDRRAADRQ